MASFEFASVMSLTASLASIAVLFSLCVLALAALRLKAASALIYLSCFVASAALLVSGATHLFRGSAPEALTLALGLPWLGAHFRLDALSSVFLVILNLGSASACVFAVGYGRHEHARGRVLPFFPVFLAAMNLVVLAADAFTFLVSWEFMSLSSWALVMAHHREPENAHAGYVYILMASLGTVALLLAFGVLAGATGAYDFASIRATPPAPLAAALVLALVLVGAGSKAGLAPLHVWLPLAHPAAPSHVSALMSGVMTKVAVYGFIRVMFDLIGAPQWWWGLVVLVAGGLTAVLGVLFALIQTDLKRVLAYSTIENIGFIFVGLGLALAFEANGLPAAAALAFTAALFHAFNHTLFKSLLFFGSGAVLNATGSRDMEKQGGLIHRMPVTAFAFLVGCAAISALPPLNGFASEWLTLQAILWSPQLEEWPLKILTPGVGGLLALSAALAGACFVRAFGVVFLGRPRSREAAEAREVDPWSLAAMGALAAMCLIVGLLPGFVIDALAPATQAAVGAQMSAQAEIPWLSIVPIAESRSSYNGLLVFAFIVSSMTIAALTIHWLASRALRRTPAWDCGFPDANPITQYGAGSVAQPIRRVFGDFVFRAVEHVEMPPPGSTAPARFRVEVRDRLWDALYKPISGFISYASEKLNYLQFLTIRSYLSFVFASLVILLLALALWPQ
ncbi:MAG: hydrogenase 4 subunit B [Hyphomonadaceae bacterium]|nr:hydrogenase 4 subunit B [Hyphomonadaceae bacterium]